ncbi:MAG: BCCT family transporter, partial [Schleiferiaceae bacterium]
MSEPLRSDKKTLFGAAINPPVFLGSLAILLIGITTTVIVGEPMEEWFASVQIQISNATGWFFILLVNVVLCCLVFVASSQCGSWFAMLFSAGMGIGLIFWGVAEPIYHFNDNPFVDNTDTIAAAKSAMGITFLHYGVHAWAIYTVVGLALAFFTFNMKLPLTIRSIFYPLLGDRIYGRWGDLIDIISVIATIVGLATSLGMGAQSVNAGLEYLFGIEYSNTAQIAIIAFITALATASLLAGLDKGIRRLSELNLGLAIILLIFVLIIGPTAYLLESFVQNIGYYIDNFFKLGFWTESYQGVTNDTKWQNSWTVFYYAWWIAWSPFVGIFIARVSKGRTIREFITGVLLVPTLLTFLWMSV